MSSPFSSTVRPQMRSRAGPVGLAQTAVGWIGCGGCCIVVGVVGGGGGVGCGAGRALLPPPSASPAVFPP
eukprot:scaffold630_cov399-Prasinococcus_capsulatus_cf.AAC.22